jgi:cholesterol oxidase
VSALRLAEKGYSVRMLETGRRFEDKDFPKSTWHLRSFIWLPRFGLRGIMRLTLYKDVGILSGAGVGGGSLVYANTHYVPKRPFFERPEWPDDRDWQDELKPYYDTAKQMLGSSEIPFQTDADRLLKEVAGDLGVEDTYGRPTVGIFFGEPGETVDDPYFDGEGPQRAGCIRCGACMVGCRHNAKNTLRKNYLYLAERKGVEIEAERTVTDVRALEGGGYEVTSVRAGSWVRQRRQKIRARGVVIAAGALGTNLLLRRSKERGHLGKLSDCLGYKVRTNSEALVAVTAKENRYDFTHSIAISSSIYPDEDTHIENVTYGKAGDSMALLFTALTEAGSRITRPIHWLQAVVRHPITALKLTIPRGWSERTLILLVMQTVESSLRLKPIRLGIVSKPLRLRRRVVMQTEQDPDNPNPTFIPAANEAAQKLADRIQGNAQSNLGEALLNMPITAHILGGAVIASDAEHGVVDAFQRAFGYERLLVCDGSVVPANPGVNPSLTITALAEHAMSAVEPAGDSRRAADATAGRAG